VAKFQQIASKADRLKSETPKSLENSDFGVNCPHESARDSERRRSDLNRGWWICNSEGVFFNELAGLELENETTEAYGNSCLLAESERMLTEIVAEWQRLSPGMQQCFHTVILDRSG